MHITKLFPRKIIPDYILMGIVLIGNFNLKTKPLHINKVLASSETETFSTFCACR